MYTLGPNLPVADLAPKETYSFEYHRSTDEYFGTNRCRPSESTIVPQVSPAGNQRLSASTVVPRR
jgi:hypothetical protein